MRTLAPGHVARPSGIARVFAAVISDQQFLAAAGATLSAVIEGLLVSLVLGTMVGFAMGRINMMERSLRYYVNSLFATPMIAILPLVTLWFGNADPLHRGVRGVFLVVNACDGALGAGGVSGGRALVSRAAVSTLFDIIFPRRCPICSPAFGWPSGGR